MRGGLWLKLQNDSSMDKNIRAASYAVGFILHMCTKSSDRSATIPTLISNLRVLLKTHLSQSTAPVSPQI
jgi:hypothetical protein